MNRTIRAAIIAALSSRRPLNSRTLARIMSMRFKTPIQRVYGNLSFLSRTNAVIWISRKKGGPSYLKV